MARCVHVHVLLYDESLLFISCHCVVVVGVGVGTYCRGSSEVLQTDQHTCRHYYSGRRHCSTVTTQDPRCTVQLFCFFLPLIDCCGVLVVFVSVLVQNSRLSCFVDTFLMVYFAVTERLPIRALRPRGDVLSEC